MIELPHALKYDCGSPDCGPIPHCGTETGCVSELGGKSMSSVQYGQEASEKGSSEGELHLSEMCKIDQKTDGVESEWESLISDATDLLVFSSPNDSETFKGLIQKSMDPMTRFSTSLMIQLPLNDVDKTKIGKAVGSGEQYDTENPSADPGEASELQDIDQKRENVADTYLLKCVSSNTTEEMDSEVAMCDPHASKVNNTTRVYS